MEEPPPPLAPLGTGDPYALRMTIIRRYWHLNLKFSSPLISRSGKHEASWIGGDAIADTEPELLATVLEAMGDCGGEGHSWITDSETRDGDNLIITQRLECAFCDERERVITLYHPRLTTEDSAAEEGKNSGT